MQNSERPSIANVVDQLMPRLSVLAVLGIGCLCVPSTTTAGMVYSLVEYGDSNISVSGTITTDGTLGGLLASNFLDWQITVKGTNLPAPQTYTPTNSSFRFDVNFPSVFATEESLVVGVSGFRSSASLIRPFGTGTTSVVTWFSNDSTNSYWVGLPLGTGSGQTLFLLDSRPVVVGTAEVPEPSSLALLGIGGLSLLGYRRRPHRAGDA